MDFEECHDNSCQEGESENKNGHITVSDVILGRNGDTTIEFIDQPTYEAAPKESDGDITRIVDTQIKTGIAVNQRVPHQEEGEHPLSHEQGEEDVVCAKGFISWRRVHVQG